MSRIVLALIVCGWMAGNAAAERIAVSATDQSESGLSEPDRQANADTVKRVIDLWVDHESIDDDRAIDVGVVKLAVEPGDEEIAITAELRFAISDDHGQMVSVLSGTAKVSVPARLYRAKSLPKLRNEALIAATQAALPKLRGHLHVAPPRISTESLVQRLGAWISKLTPRPIS